jgi:hypothetical protein
MSRLAILLALAGIAHADVSVAVKAPGVNRCLDWPLGALNPPPEDAFGGADRAIFRAQLVDSVSPEPRWREALDKLKQVPLAVDRALFLYKLGRVELELHEVEAALRSLRAVALDYPRSPHAAPALILVGDWYERAGEPVQAKKYWRRARSLDSNDTCAFELNKRLSN